MVGFAVRNQPVRARFVRMWGVLAAACSVLVTSESLLAQQEADDLSPHSELRLVSGVASIKPGHSFTVALHLTLDAGWHTYWINPGDSGLPLELAWDLPAAFTAGRLLWPAPQLEPLPPLMSYGYERELVLLAEVTPAATLRPGGRVQLRGTADWLVCADVCLPATGQIDRELAVVATEPAPDAEASALIAAARQRLPRTGDVWAAGAWPDETGYTIALAAPDIGTLVRPYFFVDEPAVIEHGRPQRVARSGDTLWLWLPRSEFAGAAASQLSGVIVSDVATPSAPAYAIDISVKPSVAPAAAAVALAARDVQQTGGFDAAVRPLRAEGSSSRFWLLLALGSAFVGGLLLNLMPCVFPVLSVKAVGLLGSSTRGVAHSRRHGVAFVAGVLVSFWALAGLLLGLRAAGASVGWGFQLQSPLLVALLAMFLFLLGLGLSGVVDIGAGLTRLGAAGAGARQRDAFVTGALAVIVASPCTAPFMGGAVGLALVQPPLVAFPIFTALGVGFALPYALLAFTPRLLARLPRPGAWLERLKQLLAFPLYATVVWLVWVFARQTNVDATAVLLLALTGTAFAAWLWGSAAASRARLRRSAAVAAALVSLSAVAYRATPAGTARPGVADRDAAWEPFSAERIAVLRAERRPILIDFTAAWCLSCQVNERIALKSDAVKRAFAEANVARIRADWTSRDPVITAALQKFGRSGVPLYVMYPAAPEAAPEVLPALLTPSIVIEAVKRAARATDHGSG